MSLKTAWQETCKFIRMMQKSEPHVIAYLILTAAITAAVPFLPIYFSAQILNFPDHRSISAGNAERLLDDRFQRYSGVEQ